MVSATLNLTHELGRQFRAKIEMAVMCRGSGVGGRKVKQKCCGMQGCCVGAP